VIAPQELAVEPRRLERAKTARRRRRAHRAVRTPIVAIVLLTVAILVPLLTYVTLTANLTSLSFALAREERERNALVEETQRLDDRIARLTSPERLANLAAQLKMRDPHVYAVVRLTPPKAQPSSNGFAFLGWFRQPVGVSAP
jgi:cell division protein FtsL